MSEIVKIDLYKEDGLALSWEQKQRALLKVRDGSPVLVSPKKKVGSRTLSTENAETPDLDAKEIQSVSSEEFSESEEEMESAWEKWEKDQQGKFTVLKAPEAKADDRKVPEQVDDRVKKFQDEIAAFMNQDWLKKNSTNGFGQEEQNKEDEAKSSTKKAAKKKKTTKKKKKVKKTKAVAPTEEETKPTTCEPLNNESSSPDQQVGKIDDTSTTPVEDSDSEPVCESKPKAPANDEIDLDAIRAISLEVKDTRKGDEAKDNPKNCKQGFDGEASMQDILQTPEKPHYGSSSALSSHNSFNGSSRSSLNGSQNFKIKKVTVKKDHESAFDMSWEEKQRAILARRQADKIPAKVELPAKPVESVEQDDGKIEAGLSFEDDRKKVWERQEVKEREKILEDHESGFRLSWEEKQRVIAARRSSTS